MEAYRIKGGEKLCGEITVSGAKNAALPVLAGTILSGKECYLHNVPNINDVNSMKKILGELGGKVKDIDNVATVDTSGLECCFVSLERMKEMRSSVFLLGALLGRCGEATISQPGGCDIGNRPIDLHLYALRQLGVEIEEHDDFILCKGAHLRGGNINLAFPSVGATENAIMAATTAKGDTVIHNCAREPEIVELQDFLNCCGAKIKGAGTGTIYVEGVSNLHGCDYSIMPDRIECGTYLVAAAVTGGEVVACNANGNHMKSILQKLVETGCEVYVKRDKIYVSAKKGGLFSTHIKTGPYPEFPTDLQSPFLTLLTLAKGRSTVEENIFEKRFAAAKELEKMGAKIYIRDNVAEITGCSRLTGATLEAKDLRGGAALVCAGLAAEGETVISGIEHIERGYSSFVENLAKLGANIEKYERKSV